MTPDHPWNVAAGILLLATEPLPDTVPRPAEWLHPHTPDELAALRKGEAESRARLDEAVREWVNCGAWPASLSPWDGWLLRQRAYAAREWLDLWGLVSCGEEDPHTLIETLLVEGWANHFAELYFREMGSRLHYYQQGFEAGRARQIGLN